MENVTWVELRQFEPPRPIVPLWTGTTWNGSQRRAEWASDMLWEQPNGHAGWNIAPLVKQLGQATVLRMIHGVTIVAFGIGQTVGEAVQHLRDGEGVALTLDEAIARFGGALPLAEELDQLRERARVTGQWPPHRPGPTCYACGGCTARGRRVRS